MDFTGQGMGMTSMPSDLPSTSGNGLFGGTQAVNQAPFLTQLAQMLQARQAQGGQQQAQPQQQGSVGGMPATSGYNPNGLGAQAINSFMPTTGSAISGMTGEGQQNASVGGLPPTTSPQSPLSMLMSLFSL